MWCHWGGDHRVLHRLPDRQAIVAAGGRTGEGGWRCRGSTGASSSIVRCKYTPPEVVRLARHGQEACDWPGSPGSMHPAPDWSSRGALVDGRSDGQGGGRRRAAWGQGVAVTVLDPGELTARFPDFSNCGVPFDLTGETPHTCAPGEAFLYEEEGVTPTRAPTRTWSTQQGGGRRDRFGTMVTAVRATETEVTGVTTDSGETIDAPLVINAAGPWCNKLNDMAGVSLRWTLDPTRVQILYRAARGDGSDPGDRRRLDRDLLPTRGRGQQILVGSVLAEDEEEVVDPDDYRRSPTPLSATPRSTVFTTDSPNCPTAAASPASPGSTRSTARTSTPCWVPPSSRAGGWPTGSAATGSSWLR